MSSEAVWTLPGTEPVPAGPRGSLVGVYVEVEVETDDPVDVWPRAIQVLGWPNSAAGPLGTPPVRIEGEAFHRPWVVEIRYVAALMSRRAPRRAEDPAPAARPRKYRAGFFVEVWVDTDDSTGEAWLIATRVLGWPMDVPRPAPVVVTRDVAGEHRSVTILRSSPLMVRDLAGEPQAT